MASPRARSELRRQRPGCRVRGPASLGPATADDTGQDLSSATQTAAAAITPPRAWTSRFRTRPDDRFGTDDAATTSTGATSNAANNGLAQLADNYQTFLSLLTTQLKNQDPLSPAGHRQFTQQLTRMTEVEQQLLSNQLLQQLSGQAKGGGLTSADQLIGKTVSATDTSATLQNDARPGSSARPSAPSSVNAPSAIRRRDLDRRAVAQRRPVLASPGTARTSPACSRPTAGPTPWRSTRPLALGIPFRSAPTSPARQVQSSRSTARPWSRSTGFGAPELGDRRELAASPSTTRARRARHRRGYRTAEGLNSAMTAGTSKPAGQSRRLGGHLQ